MKRRFIKYSVIASCIVFALIYYFIYSARNQYRQHRVDSASEALNMDLEYEDVEAIDEAWEKVDGKLKKVYADTTE